MLSLAQLSKKIDAQYIGRDQAITDFSIDSRTINPGEIFVAIKGEHFDGHNFIKDAIEKGASAVVMQDVVHFQNQIPKILVKDTSLALGQMAKIWRSQFNIPVVAITGSCGKTSTKEMLAHILRQKGETLATQGNLNNHYGVPLTLLRLRAQHKFAVVELGINLVGEMFYLANMVTPSMVLITNIGSSHLEGLNSLAGVSSEKSELFKHLAEEGVAIINLDEPFSSTWEDKIGEHTTITYSLRDSGNADVKVSNGETNAKGSYFTLHTTLGDKDMFVPLLGEHTINNALAAATTAMALGADLQQLQAGFANMSPIKGRLCPYKLPNNVTLIDDSYNASVNSVKSALKLLSEFPGKHILVISNMVEMGQYAEQYHMDLGLWAKHYEIDQLLLFGQRDLLQHVINVCGKKAEYFSSKEDLFRKLKELLETASDMTILIKGARSKRMEVIVERLLENRQYVNAV
ncbi:MAG: UDP-N-acetylmuramoyl-tripeptide--D-alanyl-D-alanine ligase [Thiotrichales bacterium]|nr:MAG: UDP-N-acetylmuramoyl-tripeptide--D-alanyl-D-alanine ligase [Thiotrichales bacterium]